jgi:prepilin-type N-terminal cleavage/methylation domain-containing protein
VRTVDRTSARSGRARPGFSLIELLIVLVLSSVIMAAVVAVIVRQQRFYRGTAAIVENRSQLRQAAMMLTADLRGISTDGAGSDLYSIGENSVVFRGTFGASVVCVRNGNTIVVPPTSLASGNVLTSWSMLPEVGDTVLVFDDSSTPSGHDDLWRAYAITGVSATPGACPASSFLTTTADATSNSYEFVLSGAPPASTLRRPVRFTRVMRYELYRAADGDWYLGYCSPGCEVTGLEPVAGPLLAAGQAGAGLTLTYHNEDGAATNVRTSVARIGLSVRGKTRAQMNIEGMRKGAASDSLRVTVGIRNRQR